MTNTPYRDRNNALVDQATATGTPYHVGITLSYVGGGSDKFWTAVWAEDVIAINFGMHGARGQYILHRFPTRERAAAKFWELLRSKTAKGYAVVDAAIMIATKPGPAHPVLGDTANTQVMVNEWTRIRGDRARNPDRLLAIEPQDRERSPRTAKQGAPLLMAVTTPGTSREDLLTIWDAPASERFLSTIVISHPDCPEEARLLDALTSGTAGLFGL